MHAHAARWLHDFCRMGPAAAGTPLFAPPQGSGMSHSRSTEKKVGRDAHGAEQVKEAA